MARLPWWLDVEPGQHVAHGLPGRLGHRSGGACKPGVCADDWNCFWRLVVAVQLLRVVPELLRDCAQACSPSVRAEPCSAAIARAQRSSHLRLLRLPSKLRSASASHCPTKPFGSARADLCAAAPGKAARCVLVRCLALQVRERSACWRCCLQGPHWPQELSLYAKADCCTGRRQALRRCQTGAGLAADTHPLHA